MCSYKKNIFKDFTERRDKIISELTDENIKYSEYRNTWTIFTNNFRTDILEYITKFINEICDDPEFDLKLHEFFKECEKIYEPIGEVFIDQQNWLTMAEFYIEIRNIYHQIFDTIYSYMHKKKDFIINEIKWGVPLTQLGIALLNSGQYEKGLQYLTAADYNDKFFDPNFKGSAERILKEDFFKFSIGKFHKIADQLRNLYRSKKIPLQGSLIESDKNLDGFLKSNENYSFYLYIIINIEKIYKWDFNLIESDNNYSLHYYFKILVDLTYILEVWFKLLLAHETSNMERLMKKKLEKYNCFPEPFRRKLYDNKTSVKTESELNNQIKQFFINCFDSKSFKIINDLDILHYSARFIILIRNYSHHNVDNDTDSSIIKDFKYRIIDGFILGILSWLIAIYSHKKKVSSSLI